MSINSAGTAITGWSASDAAGKDLSKVIQFDDPRKSEPLIDLSGTDVLLKTTTDRTSLVQFRVEPVLQSSRIVGYIVLVEDVGRLRFLESEATKAQRVESLEMMAGGIAHDFNNDLQAVLSSIVAADSMTTDPNTKALLAIAEKACLHSRDLARQLLTFSRGSAVQLRAESIEQVLQDSILLSLAGSKAKSKLSMGASVGRVMIDRSQIEQVFSNLLINAVQAMPDGGTIFVSVEQTNMPSAPLAGAVKVCFRDSGPGIGREILDDLFEPYFTTKKSGSGLGLTTCQTIVKRHGGEITVASEPGQGAEFCVFLPLADPSLHGNRSSEVAKAEHATEKILLLDDNPLVQQSISELVKVMGHEITTVSTLDAALEKIALAAQTQQPFTVAILDLKFNGTAKTAGVGHEIKKISPGIRMILVSGYEYDPIMKEYAKYGFDAVLPKPFNRQSLERNLPR